MTQRKHFRNKRTSEDTPGIELETFYYKETPFCETPTLEPKAKAEAAAISPSEIPTNLKLCTSSILFFRPLPAPLTDKETMKTTIALENKISELMKEYLGNNNQLSATWEKHLNLIASNERDRQALGMFIHSDYKKIIEKHPRLMTAITSYWHLVKGEDYLEMKPTSLTK